MDQQNKRFPASLISSLYSLWQQNHIPAIYYHYTLAVLSSKKKQEQVAMMQRQIKQLKTGNHMYHIIINSLQARQRSLDIIKRNVQIINQNQSAVSLSWTNNDQQVQSQGYSLIFQSRGVDRRDNKTLIELINHLRLYQKVTYQVITSIHKWQTELVRQGYTQPIQFLYKHQDYLQKILKDTNQIIHKYPNLFENNPFLIFRREHQQSQFALIYQNLKFGHDFASKITQALQIISNHDVSIQRHRILGNYKQLGPKRKITKSQSLHKIYCNYYNSKNFLIVKDGSLKSDKLIVDPKIPFKFVNNRNILINPEITPSKFIERRHPVYLQNEEQKELKARTEQIPMTRSSSLSDFQIRKIHQKESILLANKLDPSHNMGKSLIKRLSLYDELDKTIKYKPIQMHQPLNVPHSKEVPTIETKISKQTEAQPHQKIIEQQKIESQLHFTYQTCVSQYELLKYLRDSAFKGKQMTLKDIQLIAKRVVSEKQYITFVKVTAAQYTAAWMAIKFLTKDQSIHKTVQIIFSYKFFKIPNFQERLVEQFMRKGYGVIKQNAKIVHEIQIHEKMSHQAIKIRYKVNSSIDETELKSVIKKNECLKQSRILKYHHYSKQSRYHKYCEHSDNYCQLGYDFQQAFKITIAGTNYVRLRCDRIAKVGNSYKIYHHLNDTELLMGSQLDDVLQFSSRSQIQFNSSFQEETEEKYTYLCLPELKIMHKYFNLTEKPYVVEYLTINGDIPQILSIQADKKTLKNYLIMQRPFIIGIICKNKQDFGKFLSILTFN